ncbi:hypothetical protein A7982_13304 [Minicystis rosea]|nr:hypothetical protein A7982_13304 [Minicystis rosea]
MACGCGGPDSTELFTTEHFVYYAEEGVTPPCDGTRRYDNDPAALEVPVAAIRVEEALATNAEERLLDVLVRLFADLPIRR